MKLPFLSICLDHIVEFYTVHYNIYDADDNIYLLRDQKLIP